MKKQLFIIYLTSIWLLTACTPYDSNKTNKRLLQGKWMLTETKTKEVDSIQIDHATDTIFLLFEGDIYTEGIPSATHQESYTFDVNNYVLKLYDENKQITRYSIKALAGDSLILGNDNSRRKYKKIEQ